MLCLWPHRGMSKPASGCSHTRVQTGNTFLNLKNIPSQTQLFTVTRPPSKCAVRDWDPITWTSAARSAICEQPGRPAATHKWSVCTRVAQCRVASGPLVEVLIVSISVFFVSELLQWISTGATVFYFWKYFHMVENHIVSITVILISYMAFLICHKCFYYSVK